MSIVCGALLSLCSPALAQTIDPQIKGVWDGVVAGKPVRACFNEPDDYQSFGAYYYRAHLEPIHLRHGKEQSRDEYVEGWPWEPGVAVWRIEKLTDKEVSGSWRHGRRTSSFRLTKVAGLKLGEDMTPCGSPIFHQPRLDGIRIGSKPAIQDGVRYAKLTLEYPDRKEVGVSTFALIGTSAAVRRINARLAKPFRGNPPEWHDCELTAADGNSSGGLSERIEPKLFAGKWLTAMQYDEAYCGGVHPDSWFTPMTFDLQTGNVVDLSKWLTKAAGNPKFSALLFAGWARGHDPECRETVEESVNRFSLDLELTRKGIAFYPNDLPHAAQACGDELLVPYAKVGPYLTLEGRKNVASLQAHFARKR